MTRLPLTFRSAESDKYFFVNVATIFGVRHGSSDRASVRRNPFSFVPIRGKSSLDAQCRHFARNFGFQIFRKCSRRNCFVVDTRAADSVQKSDISDSQKRCSVVFTVAFSVGEEPRGRYCVSQLRKRKHDVLRRFDCAQIRKIFIDRLESGVQLFYCVWCSVLKIPKHLPLIVCVSIDPLLAAVAKDLSFDRRYGKRALGVALCSRSQIPLLEFVQTLRDFCV